MKDESIDDELCLPGYNLLRQDRNREGGGVALYINDMFYFKRKDDLCDINVFGLKLLHLIVVVVYLYVQFTIQMVKMLNSQTDCLLC